MAIQRNIIKAAILLMIVVVLNNCNMFGKKDKPTAEAYIFYAGTYTNGTSEGIYKFSMDAVGTVQPIGLMAKTNNPSFLAFSPDRRFLLAVNEVKNSDGSGTMASFKIKGDSLKLKNSTTTGGANPCFVGVNAARDVVVANYSGGNVGLLKLGQRGKLSSLLDVQQHAGKGTTERQQAPHAHSVWFEPDGSGIIAADLGTNQLWFYSVDDSAAQLLARKPYKLDMAPGAGPRHLAFHPGKKIIYVLNELNNTITLVRKDDGGNYSVGGSCSTLPEGYSDYNLAAHIAVSSDGKFVYASNRGHNSIAIFTVNENDGSLQLVSTIATYGEWPRHFALSPDEDFLVVANQNSGNLVSFRRNKLTGGLTYSGETKIDSAVCVLFY